MGGNVFSLPFVPSFVFQECRRNKCCGDTRISKRQRDGVDRVHWPCLVLSEMRGASDMIPDFGEAHGRSVCLSASIILFVLICRFLFPRVDVACASSLSLLSGGRGPS